MAEVHRVCATHSAIGATALAQIGAVSDSLSVSEAINRALPFRCSKNHSRLRGDNAVTVLWGMDLEPSVVALYPFATFPTGGEALGASGTDGVFSCPLRNANQLLSNFVTTYAYEFNDENAPPSQSLFGGLLTFPLGAYHTSELQYLFKDADFFGLPLSPLSQKQKKLSAAMISYWTQFARTGNPNSSVEPVWFPYNASLDEFQSLTPPTPVAESNFDAAHRCSTFWGTF